MRGHRGRHRLPPGRTHWRTLGAGGSLAAGMPEVVVDDGFVGRGYGEPFDASIESQGLAARTEGVFVDHTYTAKSLAGLIEYLRAGRFSDTETVPFWQAGGWGCSPDHLSAGLAAGCSRNCGPLRRTGAAHTALAAQWRAPAVKRYRPARGSLMLGHEFRCHAGHDVLRSIVPLRGERVLLSPDLARLYAVEPKRLLQAVARNRTRFPPDFLFRLEREEWDNLKSQIAISSWGGLRKLPYAG
jgi:hypothetical protein